MKRLREHDLNVDDNHRDVVSSTARTPSETLDILVLDIFRYMLEREFISTTDLLMLAWVYVPVRCLVPKDLKGAEGLVITIYGTGEFKQIGFVGRTMVEHPEWKPFNQWLGFLQNPLNTDLFDDMTNPKLTPFTLPSIDSNISLSSSLLESAFHHKIDVEMLSNFFNFVHPDVATAYTTIGSACDADYGEKYIDALSEAGFREFAKETWQEVLRVCDYDTLGLMITLENDPPHINLTYELLSHDTEEAMEILHDAGFLYSLDREEIFECIDDDKLCTVSKLIDFGIFKPNEYDLETYEDSDDEGQYKLSSEMLQLLVKSIDAQKASLAARTASLKKRGK